MSAFTRAQVIGATIAVAIAVIFATGAPWWWPYLTGSRHHLNAAISTNSHRPGPKNAISSTKPSAVSASKMPPGHPAVITGKTLERALLSDSELSDSAKTVSKVAQRAYEFSACGTQSTAGSEATAVEVVNLSIGVFYEQIVRWGTAAEAVSFVNQDRKAVFNTDCSSNENGQTTTITGNYRWQVPANCAAPSAYIASRVNASTSYGPESSFYVEIACDKYTVSIFTISNPNRPIRLYFTFGYFYPALSLLDSIAK